MTSRRLEHQLVWITGASSGIGESLARAFAAQGARLVLSARRPAELARVAGSCASAASADVVPLDLADLDALPAKADEVTKRFGAVDIMVHNAGISQRSRAIDTSLDVDQQLMRVNYFGTIALTKALLPGMVRRRSGHFVVISSLVGIIGSPMRSGYSASKHALHGFFDSLRAEHAADGIRITMVCPGYVRTDVSVNALRGDGTSQGTMDEATARGIAPDECAERVVRATLAGDEELYVGGTERLAVYLKRYAPALFSKVLRRARVT